MAIMEKDDTRVFNLGPAIFSGEEKCLVSVFTAVSVVMAVVKSNERN